MRCVAVGPVKIALARVAVEVLTALLEIFFFFCRSWRVETWTRAAPTSPLNASFLCRIRQVTLQSWCFSNS